ncbi:hypothetical protein BDW67DRAFT_157648 [Aspergillus spinulosporus]
MPRVLYGRSSATAAVIEASTAAFGVRRTQFYRERADCADREASHNRFRSNSQCKWALGPKCEGVCGQYQQASVEIEDTSRS